MKTSVTSQKSHFLINSTNVENKFWSSYETLESTGKMRLMPISSKPFRGNIQTFEGEFSPFETLFSLFEGSCSPFEGLRIPFGGLCWIYSMLSATTRSFPPRLHESSSYGELTLLVEWKQNSSLRWLLSIALRIPTVHDFCVISACTYTRKEISHKLSPIAK